jgi:hypothetical protein
MLQELHHLPESASQAPSLREYYAGIALASLASSMGGSDPARAKTNIWKPEHIADKAVQLADAMVQRLARP